MSYPYRVVITRSVVERVSAEDRSETQLDLAGVLPAQRMRELLRAALLRHGWAPHESEAERLEQKGPRGERLTVDLGSLVVVAEVSEAGEIRKERTLEGRGDSSEPPDDADREALRKRVEEKLDRELVVSDAERAGLECEFKQRLAARLEAGAEERRRLLNELCLEVYAVALKERAASLGTVTNISEQRDSSGYELTITIRE